MVLCHPNHRSKVATQPFCRPVASSKASASASGPGHRKSPFFIYIYILLLYCSGKSQFVNQFYILFWKITIIDLLIYFIANHGKHPDWAMASSGPWLPVGKLAVQLGSKAQLTARQRLGRPPSAGTSTQSIVSWQDGGIMRSLTTTGSVQEANIAIGVPHFH